MSKVACIYLYQWSKGSTSQHNQPAWGYPCWVLPFQPHCKSSKLLIQLSHLGSSYLGVLWLICTRLMRHELNDKQPNSKETVFDKEVTKRKNNNNNNNSPCLWNEEELGCIRVSSHSVWVRGATVSHVVHAPWMRVKMWDLGLGRWVLFGFCEIRSKI